MTALAVGSSVALILGDKGYVTLATNGGGASVTVTPAVGNAQTYSLGPLPARQTFGPYSEGASVSLTNQTCGAFDYDWQGGDGGLTTTQAAAAIATSAQKPGRVTIPDGQPLGITQCVSNIGKLVCRFGSGQWTATTGAPTLTQGYTGWDGAGAATGIQSRTGMPDMLKVVPAANTNEAITLGTFATNCLTKSLNGEFVLVMYLDKQPGYSVGGTLAGTMEVALSTNGSTFTNALNVGFNNNQLREGWNFLKFKMRNPAAYLSGASVSEDHPFGIYANGQGTGADSNIVSSQITAIRILWTNMLGAGADSGTTLYFDSIWTGIVATPQIVIGCDQGPLFNEVALPLFNSYNWVGYTAYPYNTADSGTGNLTVQTDISVSTFNASYLAQLQALKPLSWDIINHTVTHANLGAYSAESNIVYQMQEARGMYCGMGMIKGQEFYASPASNTSRLSELVIKNLGFKIQRHARKTNTQITQFGIDNPQHIGAFGWGSNISPCVATSQGTSNGSVSGNQQYSKIKRAIDVIVAYGATGWIFWHGITTTGDTGSGEDLTGDNLLITASAFTFAVNYIRSLELAGSLTVCKGISGWYYGSNA